MSALILSALAVLVYYMPGLTEHLQWTRADGSLVTLWTAHFTHWSPGHLLWDALMLAVFGTLAVRHFRLRLGATFLLAAPILTLGVAAFSPELASYRGFSGFDSLLFVFVCVGILNDRQTPRAMDVTAILLLVGLIGKTIYEFITSGALFVQDMGAGVVTVPVAHAIGGTLGALLALVPTPLVKSSLAPVKAEPAFA